MLLKVIQKTQVIESKSEQIVRLAMGNLVQFRRVFPVIEKDFRDLFVDFTERLKLEVVPQLFIK